jgi:hypothetical protein
MAGRGREGAAARTAYLLDTTPADYKSIPRFGYCPARFASRFLASLKRRKACPGLTALRPRRGPRGGVLMTST